MGKLVEDLSLRDKKYVFRDRDDAGRLLAVQLSAYKEPGSIVLAIPSGGVPVASAISETLGLPMDLIIARKIHIPGNTEAGFGAIGPDDGVVLNERLIMRIGLTEEEMAAQIRRTRDVIRQRERLFRGDRPFPSLENRDAIIVDDGLASGYTMLAAVRIVKRRARKVIVAVPTSSLDSVDQILPEVDELVCLNIRSRYPFAVADAYANWYDLTDEDVLEILREVGKRV